MSDVVATLERLIRFPSAFGAGDERALAVHLEQELRRRKPDEIGLVPVAEVGAFVYARWGRPSLLVNAHLDTVPPNTGWSGDPFVPRSDGKTITGLGAADTKGVIAAILCALHDAPPRDLAVLFSGDEERHQTCVRAFLDGPHARGLTHAIICEPTGCRVGTRHRGILALEARLAGAGGHSSRADKMPAPIADLARLAVALFDWGVAHRSDGPRGFEGMCMNVAKLDGGVAFNVVPDGATLAASVRPPPGCDVAALRAELRALCASTVAAAQVTLPIDNEPFATRDLAAFAKFFPPARDPPLDLAFWTEAALLSAAGIDAVVYGPGEIEQAHAPDEWVAIADLEKARASFADLFRRGP